jgi:hypothetical protein
LLPTVGTFLILSGGPSAWLNRNLLGRRALVWIGLISYPLYLWDWPVLVFSKISVGGRNLVVRDKVVIIGASFLLAFLTCIFVETPIKRTASCACSAGGRDDVYHAGIRDWLALWDEATKCRQYDLEIPARPRASDLCGASETWLRDQRQSPDAHGLLRRFKHGEVLSARAGAIVVDPLAWLRWRSGLPVFDAEGAPLYLDANHMRASYVRKSA